MSKKTIIGVVIAIILIIVAVIGYVLLGNASEMIQQKLIERIIIRS